MSLLIVNLLPKDDPAALAAIETLGAAAPDHRVIHACGKIFVPAAGKSFAG